MRNQNLRVHSLHKIQTCKCNHQSVADFAADINSADGEEATKREFEANETCTTGVD